VNLWNMSSLYNQSKMYSHLPIQLHFKCSQCLEQCLQPIPSHPRCPTFITVILMLAHVKPSGHAQRQKLEMSPCYCTFKSTKPNCKNTIFRHKIQISNMETPLFTLFKFTLIPTLWPSQNYWKGHIWPLDPSRVIILSVATKVWCEANSFCHQC
jgi:hypothetical protein